MKNRDRKFPVADSKATILSNEWVNEEYKHMVIDVAAHGLNVAPGQFFNLFCPTTDADQPFFRRPMSTYYADEKTVGFLYKVVGAGTRGLATMDTGEALRFVGPLGVGFNLDSDWQHILVVGRGVGLATLAPLAEAAAEKGIKVTAILSAKDKARLMSQHRFLDVGADVIEVMDSDGSSQMDNVEAKILDMHAKTPFDAVFTCGSNRLTGLLQRLANDLDIAGEVAVEQNMACGLGVCFGCVRPMNINGELKSKRVCSDGPVFNIKEVVL
jgi:dihydroorotate dehydrogenase electron transfer subunit